MGLFRSSSPQSGELQDLSPVKPQDAAEDGSALALPSSRMSGSKETVLGQGQIFEGTLSGEGSVRLDGAFKGDVTLQGSLSISMSGSLLGTIEATNILVSGVVDGDITAHGKLRLTRGCKVKGDLKAQVLSIEDGAYFDGRSSMLKEESGASPALPGTSLPPVETLQFGKNYDPGSGEEQDGDGEEPKGKK